MTGMRAIILRVSTVLFGTAAYVLIGMADSRRGLTRPPSGLSLEHSRPDCGKNAHCNRRPARYVAAHKEALCRGDFCTL